MGHKTHPVGFRLGIIKDWNAQWFAARGKDYAVIVRDDLRIRDAIKSRYRDAGIASVTIERGTQDLVVVINTARPGIVIGRGGQRVEELRQALEQITGGKRIRVNVQEIRQPELEAYLVARNVADQLERRVSFRRAIRQTVTRAVQAGAKGIKIIVSGRLDGAEIARKEKAMEGRVPLHTLRANIDYGLAEAATSMGRVGVKVWIYKGDILPEPKIAVSEETDMDSIQVMVQPAEEEKEVVAEAVVQPAAEEEKEVVAEAVVQPAAEEEKTDTQGARNTEESVEDAST